MKIKDSLNVTFDETPPPSKTSPLVDDDLDEEEVVKVTKNKNLENDIKDETLEVDEIVNIKESKNHPLDNVIRNLNQRTLRFKLPPKPMPVSHTENPLYPLESEEHFKEEIAEAIRETMEEYMCKTQGDYRSGVVRLKMNHKAHFELKEPTIKEGEVVDEPKMNIVKTRCDNEIIDGLDEYPSYRDFDMKIHIDYTYNLKFSCMIGKIKYKGKNVGRAFMNVPIFVGNFSVVIHVEVVENMDSYRNEGMGDIIIGRPFCKDADIKARQFDEMIII
nr:glycosyl transferase, family 8 [Tanacetum cinerariifolium]GEY63033.1 glycosyl transferase, family 8 [Tanacetum cinerariifolium]